MCRALSAARELRAGEDMKRYRLREFGEPLEAEEISIPEPHGSEVLLRVVGVGLCHSDLHLIEGSYDLGRGARLSVKQRGVSLPLTLGHETVGRVTAAGVSAHGIEGDRNYLIYPWIGCGTCKFCVSGDENLCAKPRSLGVYQDGGYAEYILVPHPRYLLDLDGLDPLSAAPYACSGLTAYSALKKVGPVLHEEPIVIIGAGGLGLMSLALLQALGGFGAIVVDISEDKRDEAMKAGALGTVDGKAPDAVNQVIMATNGSPRVIIDFVGSEDTATLAFECIARGGKIICVGLFGGATPWSLPKIPMKAVTIQGNYTGNLAELKELLELARLKGVRPIPITLAPLDQANEMLEKLRLGEISGRAVLIP
jgi:propanol-preferring alcohol dehydrogenase